MEEEEFESQFQDILANNDFKVEPVEVEEMAHTLEIINSVALQVTAMIVDALDDKLKFPEEAISIFRMFHDLGTQFIELTADICTCDDCDEDEEDEEDE